MTAPYWNSSGGPTASRDVDRFFPLLAELRLAAPDAQVAMARSARSSESAQSGWVFGEASLRWRRARLGRAASVVTLGQSLR